jgi:hypothetical protein
MNRSAYYIKQAKRCARIANGSVDDTRKERLSQGPRRMRSWPKRCREMKAGGIVEQSVSGCPGGW